MMKTIVTFGVFDLLHLGHLRLFVNIKKMCGIENKLIVAVQDSAYILKYKPDAKIVYSNEERLEMIRSLKPVDSTIIYTDVDVTIKTVDFDIWAKGPDQIHSGFQRAIAWCKENNKKVIEIPRTAGISSTLLKSHIIPSRSKERSIVMPDFIPEQTNTAADLKAPSQGAGY